MTLEWKDIFFEEQADRIIQMFGIPEGDTDAIKEEWSEQMFEIDLVAYRNGEKYILDGRKSALSALQTICEQYVMKRAGVKDRSRELVSNRK